MKQYAIMFGIALLAVYASNKIDAIKNIVG